jgi:hypothetical protein
MPPECPHGFQSSMNISLRRIVGEVHNDKMRRAVRIFSPHELAKAACLVEVRLELSELGVVDTE